MTDWRAVLLNLLVRNPHAELDYPGGAYLEPFMEVLREAEQEAERLYSILRAENKAKDEQFCRDLVTTMKPQWDEARTKIGRKPIDIEAEVSRLMAARGHKPDTPEEGIQTRS